MFTIIGYGIGVLVVGMLSVFAINKAAGVNVFKWARAGIGQGARNLAGTNLNAQLQEAVDQALQKVAKGREGLGRIGGMKRSIERQLKDLQAEESQYVTLIKQTQAAGDPNNTLQGYALQLATTREQIAINQAQYDEISAQFDDYSQDILDGDAAVKEVQQKAKMVQARLQMSESKKAMAEFANGFNPNKISGDLAVEFNRVEERISQNLGQADAAGVGAEQRRGERADRQLQKKLAADAILAEFSPVPQIPQQRQVAHDPTRN